MNRRMWAESLRLTNAHLAPGRKSHVDDRAEHDHAHHDGDQL